MSVLKGVNRVLKSCIGIGLCMTIVFSTGCNKENGNGGYIPSQRTPVPIVTSLDKAGMTADGIASYYMYCILRGDYERAWDITYKPDELVFSDKLLKLKYEEIQIKSAEETIMPLGYGSGINKIYNDDGELINKDGQLINDAGEVIDEDGNVVDDSISEDETEDKSDEVIEPDTEPEAETESWGSYGEATINMSNDKLINYGDFTYSIDSVEQIPEIMDNKGVWQQAFRTGIFMYGADIESVDETKDVPVTTVVVSFGYDNSGYNVQTWKLKVRGNEENGFEVMVPSEFLSNEVVKIKVPDGVTVKVNGAKVNSKLCGVDDYYVLSQYPAYSQIDVELSCVPLESMTKKLDIVDTGAVTPETEEYWNIVNENGELNKYELSWDLSKDEIKSAEAWLGKGIQGVFDSIIAGEDINSTDFGGYIWSKADREAFKPDYLKAVEAFKDTKVTEFTDLSVMDCTVWRDDNIQYEDVGNEVINKDAINLHIDLKYSYIKMDKETKEKYPYDSELRVQVQLTKEDGEWKFYSIPNDMLSKLN